MTFAEIISSFLLGLGTPLGAVCVIPLYPAFLAYLSNQFAKGKEPTKKQYTFFGTLITFGVIIFMLILGLLFTTILQKSLTNVIGIVSPIAFGILAIISLLLIFNFDFSRIFPQIHTPTINHPILSALSYGFFFGAIVIPCNPGFIATFLSRAFLFTDFYSSILNFIFFGFGLGFPLLAFSLLSANWNQKIISFLIIHKRLINLVSGIIMLGISIYYLLFVFKIFS